MDTQNIKHHLRDDPTVNKNNGGVNNDHKSKGDKRRSTAKRGLRSLAKRGLRSLAVAVSLPLSMTLFITYFFGSSDRYVHRANPIGFPSLWFLHMTFLASSFLMGLSAWLIWADRVFHKKPIALFLYLAQLRLSLAWDPIMFRMRSTRVGLIVCLAILGAFVWCYRVFKQVNPIAGDFVKPCLVWAAFLAIVNLKLVFLRRYSMMLLVM